MKATDLLPNKERKNILECIGKDIVSLHKQRIQKQIEVDGSPMVSLSPRTEERKKKKGGQSKVNASKRMMDTGDFMRNAFLYKVKGDSLQVYISDHPHLFKSVIESFSEKRKKENEGKSWKQKMQAPAPPPLYSTVSYRTIARMQERSAFGDSSIRNQYNPGAKFFGLNPVEQQKYKVMALEQAIPIIKQNYKTALNKMLKIK